MTPALWVTLIVAVMTVSGTLAGVAALLINNNKNLKRDREKAEIERKVEDEKQRASDRDAVRAEAERLRKEVRDERDRLEIKAEKLAEEATRTAQKLAEEAETAAIEREEFRQEISLLQRGQRDWEKERQQFVSALATKDAEIETLHVKYKREIEGLQRQITELQGKLDVVDQRTNGR